MPTFCKFVHFDVGGLGGRAIYLDTEGGFCAERMSEIAEATRNSTLKQLESMETRERLVEWQGFVCCSGDFTLDFCAIK